MNPPLIAFYGDDFTGSADVMEVLQWSGIKTVLFLEPPTPEQLALFEGVQAIGVAGCSRAMSRVQMERELSTVFQQLQELGASLVHYKTCSTFDSSEEIGNIGCAIEQGQRVFGRDPVVVVVGAPNLGRYQVFGNLFARSGLDTEPFRLDRHPTMSRHPITPMLESDLRRVLASQSPLKVELVDVLKVSASTHEQLVEHARASDSDVILFDVLDEDHLCKIGAMLDLLRANRRNRFVVGSSGIEYALTAAWSHSRTAAWSHSRTAAWSHSQLASERQKPSLPSFGPVDQLLVITGSCSPVNDRQIAIAESHGFILIGIDTPRLAQSQWAADEVQRVANEAIQLLRSGANVMIHSSRGPKDPRVHATCDVMMKQGLDELQVKLESGPRIGPQLGSILNQILAERPLQRIGVAGGDTSGYIARALGITALEAIAPVAPGSPLCRVHSNNAKQGMEIFFKGGQVGRDNVWLTMLNGNG